MVKNGQPKGPKGPNLIHGWTDLPHGMAEIWFMGGRIHPVAARMVQR